MPTSVLCLTSPCPRVGTLALVTAMATVAVEAHAHTPRSSHDETLSWATPAVVVFGATPAGISAAVAAARTGGSETRVVLVEPSRWIGGMMAGGLGCTDQARVSSKCLVDHAIAVVSRASRFRAAVDLRVCVRVNLMQQLTTFTFRTCEYAYRWVRPPLAASPLSLSIAPQRTIHTNACFHTARGRSSHTWPPTCFIPC